MAGRRSDWENISELGSGGQSTVFLVRNSSRQNERAESLLNIRSALDGDKRAELATAICSFPSRSCFGTGSPETLQDPT
jgi:hypothetical protein